MEDNIEYESENFYVFRQGKSFEIRLHNTSGSYSVRCGEKNSLEDAIKFVRKMEDNPKNVKELRDWYGLL